MMYSILNIKQIADALEKIDFIIGWDDMMSESEWHSIKRISETTGLGIVLSSRLYRKTGDVDKAIALFHKIMDDLNNNK